MGCFKSKPKTCPEKSKKPCRCKPKQESDLTQPSALPESGGELCGEDCDKSGAPLASESTEDARLTKGSVEYPTKDSVQSPSGIAGSQSSKYTQRKTSIASDKIQRLSSLSEQRKDSTAAYSAATVRNSETLSAIAGQKQDGLIYSATGTTATTVPTGTSNEPLDSIDEPKFSGETSVGKEGAQSSKSPKKMCVIVERTKKGICCVQVPCDVVRTFIDTHADNGRTQQAEEQEGPVLMTELEETPETEETPQTDRTPEMEGTPRLAGNQKKACCLCKKKKKS